MSTRERWVVYPLLFLSLGIGLNAAAIRDVLEPRGRELNAGRIVCRELNVVGADGKPQTRLSATDGGEITLVDPEGGYEVLIGLDHEGTRYGVFLHGPGMDRDVPLTLYTRARPAPRKPPVDGDVPKPDNPKED